MDNKTLKLEGYEVPKGGKFNFKQAMIIKQKNLEKSLFIIEEAEDLITWLNEKNIYDLLPLFCEVIHNLCVIMPDACIPLVSVIKRMVNELYLEAKKKRHISKQILDLLDQTGKSLKKIKKQSSIYKDDDFSCGDLSIFLRGIVYVIKQTDITVNERTVNNLIVTAKNITCESKKSVIAALENTKKITKI